MSTRLRASCDACHKAKVRCTAGAGDCLRCQTMGKECQYSPALPRLSQKKRVMSSNVSESSSSPVAGPPVSRDNRMLLRLSTSSRNQSFEPTLDDNLDLHYPDFPNFDLTDMQWNSWEGHEDDPTHQMSLSASHSSRYGDTIFSAVPSLLSAASVPTPCSNDQSPDYRDPSNSSVDLDSPQANPKNRCNSWVGSLKDPSTQVVSHANHAETEHNQQEHQQDHERSCTCLSKLLLAIQTVHKNPTVAIDKALRVNREAVACCWSVIECSCMSKLELVIISSGLLALVLNFYQSVLESVCGGGADESLMMASTPRPRPVEVTFGGFGIEKEDQKFFLRELITRGVRKIDNHLLPAFRPLLGLEAQNLTDALVSHLSRQSKAIICEKN